MTRGVPTSSAVSARGLVVDEIWSFVYAKEKNVPYVKKSPNHAGDVWTWLAFCVDTKLVPSWHVGDRSAETALAFMTDLESRLAQRVQLTTDGNVTYLDAVDMALGGEIDYAMLIKTYGNTAGTSAETRYSPAQCTGVRPINAIGHPNLEEASTSYVERQNLTVRMSLRRFTRLTNAFSKKNENHAHAVSFFMLYYNFCRIHSAHRVTPAMEAGVVNTMWDVDDMVDMIEAFLPNPAPRGPYGPRKKKTEE